LFIKTFERTTGAHNSSQAQVAGWLPLSEFIKKSFSELIVSSRSFKREQQLRLLLCFYCFCWLQERRRKKCDDETQTMDEQWKK
jgi:hypothetical protein